MKRTLFCFLALSTAKLIWGNSLNSCEKIRFDKLSCERFCNVQNPSEEKLKCSSDDDNITINVTPRGAGINCAKGSTSLDFDKFNKLPSGRVGGNLIWENCPLPNNKSLLSFLADPGIFKRAALLINENLEQHHFIGLESLEDLRIGKRLDFEEKCNDRLRLFSNHAELDFNSEVFTNLVQLKNFQLQPFSPIKMASGMFRNQENLFLIALTDNILVNLTGGVFTGLKKLIRLEIHRSILNKLPEDIFKPLISLEVVSMIENEIDLVDILFTYSKKLKTVMISRTCKGLIIPLCLFCNLPKLQSVHLAKNQLSSLPDDLFTGSSSIEYLDFAHNLLTSLPSRLLIDLKLLSGIDLSHNRLSYIEASTLAPVQKFLPLVRLDLSSNQITHFDKNFARLLPDLLFINVSSNLLTSLEPFSNLFKQRKTPFLKPVMITASVSRIDKLSASNTSLESHTNLLKQTETLMLEKLSLIASLNRLESFKVTDWLINGTEVTIDVSRNNIHQIIISEEYALQNNRNSAVHWPLYSNFQPHLIIKWNMNYVTCDCTNYDFIKFLSLQAATKTFKPSKDVSLLDCVTFSSDSSHCVDDPTMKVNQIKPIEVACQIDEFCPSPCRCSKRPENKSFEINCKSSELESLVEYSDYENYEIQLDMSHNNIKAVKLSEGPRLANLLLSHNNITEFKISRGVKTLKLLHLHNNKLESLDRHELNYLSENQVNLTLAGNFWPCDCTTEELFKFSLTNRDRILDFDYLLCIHGDGSKILFNDLTADILCPGILLELAAAAVIVAVIVGIITLYYKYRKILRMWLQINNYCSCLFKDDNPNMGEKFDAFIIYAHEDEDFIVDHLMPELEGKDNYKLCIHGRDWTAGLIIDNVINSIETSKRTIVVVSQNFLKSPWCAYEFRTAHTDSITERKSRLIVIVLEKIEAEAITNVDIRDYIKLNTYIEWKSPHFWMKLRYAMPRKAVRGKNRELITTKF